VALELDMGGKEYFFIKGMANEISNIVLKNTYIYSYLDFNEN
jgi:hypothetical protein